MFQLKWGLQATQLVTTTILGVRDNQYKSVNMIVNIGDAVRLTVLKYSCAETSATASSNIAY